eukprot:GHVT01066880.1.p1 GENE.GHVT01066880.1~~GHVT01066880.1.p1  ORF type:complete len:160 (-),score=15.19 GHVT01066880.1:581-1060(-)
MNIPDCDVTVLLLGSGNVFINDDSKELKQAHTVAKRTTQGLGIATDVLVGSGLGTAGVAAAALLTTAIADKSIPKNSSGEDVDIDEHFGKNMARGVANVVFNVGTWVATTLLLSALTTKCLGVLAKKREQACGAQLDEKVALLKSWADKRAADLSCNES